MIIPFGFLKGGELYDNVSVVFELEVLDMNTLWTNAILKLRRSSDNQTAFIFTDGNSIGDEPTLTGFISTSSNTSPSATTLGSWVGGNDAFVEEWIGMTDNNTIDSNKTAIQLTGGNQPQFISSGAIITENGKPAISFNGSQILTTPNMEDLDPGKDFTVFTVAQSDTSAGFEAMFTAGVGTNRFSVFLDRSNVKELNRVRALNVNYQNLYLSQQNNSNQRLLTSVLNSNNLEGYLNGVIQGDIDWIGDYQNVGSHIGGQVMAGSLVGTMQSIIICPTASTKQTIIEADIINRFSI